MLQYIKMNSHIKLDVVLLDLDMPIMDGFEACRQITDFYKNLSTYRLEKPNQRQDQETELIKQVSMPVSSIIDGKFTQPLMVAYSGLVNDEVRKNAKEAGFKVVIESPLTIDRIKEHILAKLDSRSENISFVKSKFY